MPLVDKSETVRVSLTHSEEWVDVRARVSKGEQVEIQKRIMGSVSATRQQLVDGSYQVDIKAAIEEGNFALFDAMIVGWSFSDPVSPENIRRLDAQDADLLAERFNELYPVFNQKDDDRKNSSENGQQPSSETPTPSPIDSTG